eukprot:765639-Prorocentrum_minimum.AAC.1
MDVRVGRPPPFFGGSSTQPRPSRIGHRAAGRCNNKVGRPGVDRWRARTFAAQYVECRVVELWSCGVVELWSCG